MKAKLEKEFNKLNKEYIRIDKLMSSVCNTEDTFKYEMQLEEIQNKMSEISAKMENENN
jgi:hypothetical protein